jgi:hypothetical protein
VLFQKHSINDYIQFGLECKTQKATLNKEEFKDFQQGWGKTFVNRCIKIADWFSGFPENLGALKDKILNLPFSNVFSDALVQLAKIPYQSLRAWYESIAKQLEQKGKLFPEDIREVAKTFVPKSKTTIKLFEPLTEDDWPLVAKTYKLSPDDLKELKDQCSQFTEGQEQINTEHLLTVLDERWQKDPLKILSTGDGHKWQLQKKEEEIEKEKSRHVTLKRKHEQEINQLIQKYNEQIGQLTQMYEARFAQLEKQIEKLMSKKQHHALSEIKELASVPSQTPKKSKGFG